MGQPRKGKPIPKVVDKNFFRFIAVITRFKNSVKIDIFEREIVKSHKLYELEH